MPHRRLFALVVAVCVSSSFGTIATAGPITGKLLIQSQQPGAISYRIDEVDASGSVLQSFTPVLPPLSSDLLHPRDLVMGSSGQVHLYNGTFDPYLSTLDPTTNTWTHVTHSGWTTVNNGSYGGIARFGDNIFVTNMGTAGNPSEGIVVFSESTGASYEVAGLEPTDLTLGLDNNLWVLDSGVAYQYDPVTLLSGSSVSLAAAVGSDVRSIAVDQFGNFFVGDWNGTLSILASDGSLIDSLSGLGSIIDVDVSWDGELAIGTRSDGVWLTDSAFSSPTQINAGRWSSFVTFVQPHPVPEPATIAVVGLAGLFFVVRRRRLSHS